jgi:hypothetical protein
MEAVQPMLQYAQKPPWHRRRWLRRALRVLFGFVLIVVALMGARKLWQDYQRRAVVLRWQQTLLSFSPPNETVVYDEFRDTIQARLRTAGSVANLLPEYLSLFQTSDDVPDAVVYLPKPLRSWPSIAYPPQVKGIVSGGSTFIGERDAGHGSRIVLIDIDSYEARQRFIDNRSAPNQFADGRFISTEVLRPCSWLHDLRSLSYDRAVLPLYSVPPGELRFYAGRADPANTSHFTFDYETKEGRGAVDGWLMPDDSVRLTVRSGPATRPTSR